MAKWIWINGEVFPAAEAVIPAMDRGFLLGEGFFETMAVVNGRIWKAGYHLDRLLGALKACRIPWTTDVASLHAILHTLPDLPADGHGVFRLTVTAGPGDRGLLRQAESTPTAMAFVNPPPDVSTEPLRCIWSTVRRNEHSPASRYKSNNYLDAIIARQEATERGTDDALLTSLAGHAACFTAGNLLAWDGHHLMAPTQRSGALPGTTLRVLETHYGGDNRWLRPALSPWQLRHCTGLFRLNTLSPLRVVGALEEDRYDPHAIKVLADELCSILRASVIADCGEHSSESVLPW